MGGTLIGVKTLFSPVFGIWDDHLDSRGLTLQLLHRGFHEGTLGFSALLGFQGHGSSLRARDLRLDFDCFKFQASEKTCVSTTKASMQQTIVLWHLLGFKSYIVFTSRSSQHLPRRGENVRFGLVRSSQSSIASPLKVLKLNKVRRSCFLLAMRTTFGGFQWQSDRSVGRVSELTLMSHLRNPILPYSPERPKTTSCMHGQLCNRLSPSSTSSIDKPSKPVGPCCSIWLFHSPYTFFNSDIMPQNKKRVQWPALFDLRPMAWGNDLSVGWQLRALWHVGGPLSFPSVEKLGQ